MFIPPLIVPIQVADMYQFLVSVYLMLLLLVLLVNLIVTISTFVIKQGNKRILSQIKNKNVRK